MKYRFQERKSKKIKPALKNRFWVQVLKKSIALSMLVLALLIIEPMKLYEQVVSNFNMPSNFINFEIKEIVIEGNHKITTEEILKVSNLHAHKNILTVDLNEVKKNIESNPWIWGATVERLFPSTIKITIDEEKIKAVFLKNQKTYFINHQGDVIEEVSDYNLARNYIYLIGDGATNTYSEILDFLYNSEKIYSNIEGLIKINNRRWDVKLKNNITLKLPEDNLIDSLAIFDNILQKNNLLEYPCVIDLRILPDKIYIKF